MTRVKICGITNLEDALLSVKFGADALGFNFYEKSARYIHPTDVNKIVGQLSKPVQKIGVFVNESVETIANVVRAAGLDAVQLHGDESPDAAESIKRETGAITIKAFRVSNSFNLETIHAYAVDAVLLDSFSVSEFGGTGKKFDWEIAAQVRRVTPNIYLAGGLSNDNIVGALQAAGPYAVDVCSAIESAKGKKDKIKLINFITRVKEFDWWKERIDRKLISIQDIRDYLKLIHLRPAFYIGVQSITALGTYLAGFRDGLVTAGTAFDFYPVFEEEFHNYIKDRLGKRDLASLNGFSIRLYDKADECRAFEHFFALLSEYYVEAPIK